MLCDDPRPKTHKTNRIWALIVAPLMLLFCACTRSPEDAFNRGDYVGAAELWLQKAEHGDLDAACRCSAALGIIGEGGYAPEVKARARPLSERLNRVVAPLGEQGGSDIDQKRLAGFISCFRAYLERAARAGNANAEFLLAEQYRTEEGKAAEVERLVQSAAENGNARAQWEIGVKHMFDEDQSILLRWWKLSAAKGYFPALQSLGTMYRDGRGVPQDFELAAKLFSEGAQQGFSNAQMAFGQMYEKGQGVPQDFVQAHFWFNVAGIKGTEQDRKRANDARDAIAHTMTAEQVAAAQRMAREWRPKDSPY